MEQKEEEEKEQEEVEEEKDEDDLVRIVAEAITSLPHTPPNIVTSMESASTSEIASTTATSFSQSTPTTSQLQEAKMEVPTTSFAELIVTSSSTELAPSAPVSSSCIVSTLICSTILSVPDSTSVLSTSELLASTSTSAISSIIDTSMGILPSVAPILGSISVLDSVNTSISLQSLSPIPFFTASPSISTIVSIPKVKPIIKEVEQRQPLKLLITGKEIEEDIDLDTEIEIPKIDFDIATIEEVRFISQLLEKKARQKQLRSKRDKEYRIIKSAKNIITEAIGVEVDSTQHILI